DYYCYSGGDNVF
nr:immunoglobulin light chain junction region [Macaca mulatta]